MKNHKNKIVILIIGLIFSTGSFAQTPNDAIMMGSRMICFLVDYQYGSFDQYWEGARLRENETIATIKRQSSLAMTAIGISNDLNFYIGIPYVSTRSTLPNGGKFAGANGFQDLSFAIKYKAIQKELAGGQLRVLGTVGYSTPATNYLADYRPYAIGDGAPELSYRGIVQYRKNNGMYFRVAGAYVWKGYTEAEREYYYNNGSYYTKWMDVPSAITVEGVIGAWFMNDALQLEVNFMSSNSLSGDDIRAYNAAQPTNKVNWTRLGVLAHYYFKQVEGLGIVGYFNHNVAGRNAPKMTAMGVGVTYFFNFLKPRS